MPVIVGVAHGGAFGASARYLLDRLIEQHTESVFPW
jgi:fluoride ion exporter CrcB/FEX